MTVELNWHEGDEQSDVFWDHAAEPLPVAPPRPAAIVQGADRGAGPSRLKLLLLGAGLGVLLGLLALGAVLGWRVYQGNQLAQRDVTAAVAQVLEAQAMGDVRRYAELLDGSDTVWKARLVAGLRQPDQHLPSELTVERVRLFGDLAEAEVTETADGTEQGRMIYFRLSDGQWRLAPPAQAPFGDEKSTSTTHFTIHYRQRDQRFLPALTNLAEGTYVALCGELSCSADTRPLELRLAYDAQADALPVTPGVVRVPSPSLTGWVAGDQPGASFAQRLASQIAMQMAATSAPSASESLLEVIGLWAMEELAGARSSMDDALAGVDPPQELMSLERTWAAVVRRNSNDWLARAQLGSVLRFAQATWGSNAVGLLLAHMSNSFDTTARRAYGVDGQTFQQMWLAWLAGQRAPATETSTG